ncbi:hypothetical protein LTR86_001311 [Recurvomyces mirabilis]|nr:hypothetical protein LTR86_001311 [Recurvomyces mirabilis]
MGSTSLVYTALESWETRLLKVHPGLHGDDIITDMSVAVVTFEKGLGIALEHRNVEYNALSYAWGGDHLPLQDIICNEARVQVRQNLADALQELRDNAKAIYLWVDALCINQDNPEEKAAQIRNMKLIYGLANTVVVWLGLPQDNTKYADWFLHRMGLEHFPGPLSNFEKSKVYSASRDESYEGREDRLNTKIKSCSASFVQETDQVTLNRTMQGLLELALRPWLRRVWVMQEIYAARHNIVRCGSHRLNWFAFSRLDSIALILANTVRTRADSSRIDNSNGPPRSTRSADLALNEISGSIKQLVTTTNSTLSSITGLGSTSTNTMGAIKESLSFLRVARRRREKPDDLDDNPALSVLELLIRGSHLQASDPRDKIYALLGFSSVPTFYGPGDYTGHEGIRIDYNISTLPQTSTSRFGVLTGGIAIHALVFN